MKNKIEFIPLDDLFHNMSEEQQDYALDNQFPYLYAKAERLILLGPEKYRQEDYFQEPRGDNETLELIFSGCIQICNGKGLTKENPLSELGVSGFYSLMRMFHFDSVSRRTDHSFEYNGKSGALDEITFEHRVDKRTSTIFNFCEYPDLLNFND